ncbi:hypothetical protein MRB53_038390 [Persea americana]|nr:hypothetical protein MRB53_038390 [Persea americana]
MATTVDKIKDIETEMARTQKNKATSFHLGQLKAKLAKLKKELLTPQGGGGGGGVGFDVARTGVASVGFIGFPSVGKSTLMSRLTGQHSEAAAYEFTTLTTVPGQVMYNGCQDPDARSPGYHPRCKRRKRSWQTGHCCGQDMQSHLHRARCQQASYRQAGYRERARRIWDQDQ